MTTDSDDETLQSILAEVFIDTAPSITITTLTNVLAFGVGALTPTPEIQLFSIGNAVAIIIDYIYQVFISYGNDCKNVKYIFSGQYMAHLWQFTGGLNYQQTAKL